MQYFYHVDLVTRNTTKICFNKFGAKMSIQTFSKVFLFLNNKEKTENIFPITTGPAHGNDWPTAAFGLRNRAEGKATARLEAPAQGRPGPARAEARRPRHAGVPGAMAVRPLPAGQRPLPAMTGQAGVRAGSARRWQTRAGHSRG